MRRHRDSVGQDNLDLGSIIRAIASGTVIVPAIQIMIRLEPIGSPHFIV
jgi:hypothetical protein